MSTLKADTIVAADGTSPVTLTKQEAAKSWGHVTGTGTASLDDSLNVSTLTDVGTGQYRLTYTNSMSNSDYSCVYAGSTQLQIIVNLTTSLNQVLNRDQNNSNEDAGTSCSMVIGDLA